jgi:hypothetical protein
MDMAEELVRRSGAACRVCTSAELEQLGIYPRTVTRLVASGRWQRLWRGVYLCGPHPPTALVRAHAAVKHASQPGATAIVTGLAGASALGMRWVPDHTRVQVLVGPEVRRASNDAVLVRRAWDATTVPTWGWGGLAVAEPPRLVVDGARECASLRDVRGLLLGAVADGHASPAELTRLLDAGAVGGTAMTRRAVRDAERGAVSPPEAEVADGLFGRRQPFALNRSVWVDDLFVGCLDGYLIGTGVGYEVDSREWHGSSRDMSATLQRHERANRAGLTLVHVTPVSYRANSGAFLARLDAAVAHRRATGLGEPAGLRLVGETPVLR